MAKVTIYPGKEFLRRIEQLQGSLDQAIPKADTVTAVNLTSFPRSEYARWEGGWRHAEAAMRFSGYGSSKRTFEGT